MVDAWYVLVQVIGTGCYRSLVHVDSDRLTVAVVDSVTVKSYLHLTLIR
jgi:hypothetical protein